MSPELLAFLEELVARGLGPEEAIQLAAQAGMLAPQTSGMPDDRGTLQSMLANRQAGINTYTMPSGNSGNYFDPVEAERMGKIMQPAVPSLFGGLSPVDAGVNVGTAPITGSPRASVIQGSGMGDDFGMDTYADNNPGYPTHFEDGSFGKERSVARPNKSVDQMVQGGMRGVGRSAPPPQSKRPVTPPGQAKKVAGQQSARSFTPAGPKPTQKPRPKPSPGTRKF